MTGLCVVTVVDRRSGPLVGHDGCTYVSPAQPAEQALALVRVLLGCPPAAIELDGGPWRRPVAGGARTIAITEA